MLNEWSSHSQPVAVPVHNRRRSGRLARGAPGFAKPALLICFTRLWFRLVGFRPGLAGLSRGTCEWRVTWECLNQWHSFLRWLHCTSCLWSCRCVYKTMCTFLFSYSELEAFSEKRIVSFQNCSCLLMWRSCYICCYSIKHALLLCNCNSFCGRQPRQCRGLL